MLATHKPQYHASDLFLSQDFRGLFLADHQDSIKGDLAFKQVMDLNQKVVSKFNTLSKFNNDLENAKNVKEFYDGEIKETIRRERKERKILKSDSKNNMKRSIITEDVQKSLKNEITHLQQRIRARNKTYIGTGLNDDDYNE